MSVGGQTPWRARSALVQQERKPFCREAGSCQGVWSPEPRELGGTGTEEVPTKYLWNE